MRERIVKRFYCEHCKKAGLSRFHMAKHEMGCTGNPDRVCRMCDYANGKGANVPDMIAAIEAGGMKALREVAGDCPACILAAIRQFPWPPYPEEPTWAERFDPTPYAQPVRHPFWEECSAFKYKEECADLWQSVNEDRALEVGGYH